MKKFLFALTALAYLSFLHHAPMKKMRITTVILTRKVKIETLMNCFESIVGNSIRLLYRTKRNKDFRDGL